MIIPDDVRLQIIKMAAAWRVRGKKLGRYDKADEEANLVTDWLDSLPQMVTVSQEEFDAIDYIRNIVVNSIYNNDVRYDIPLINIAEQWLDKTYNILKYRPEDK